MILTEKKLIIEQNNARISYSDYLNYLDDLSIDNWEGFSIQPKQINYAEEITYSDLLTPIEGFLKFIFQLLNDSTNSWIVQHEYQNFPWLPFEKENKKELLNLYKFFDKQNIPYKFKGGLLLDTEHLLKIRRELFLYPFLLKYKDINIYNFHSPVIVKFTHHLTVDLITNNKLFFYKMDKIKIDKSLKKIKYK